jgi:hypothetical protein
MTGTRVWNATLKIKSSIPVEAELVGAAEFSPSQVGPREAVLSWL